VNLSAEIALSLNPVELGVYVKGKALLASGRRAFSLTDLEGDIDQSRDALSALLDLKLVVHRGGGWYALARLPTRATQLGSTLASKMSAVTSKRAIRSKKSTIYEQLRDMLRSEVKKVLGLDSPVSVYAASNSSNKARYARIAKVIREVDVTAREFVDFVFHHDWSWTRDGYPGLGLICTNDFLGKFMWYVEHLDEMAAARDILSVYDKTFRFNSAHKYEDHLAALRLRTMLFEKGVTIGQFFDYAISRNWRVFDGFPPVRFLASSDFVNQCCNVLQKRGVVKAAPGVSDTYLGRILSRLLQVPTSRSSEALEDYNWSVGEAVFEPLVSVSHNSTPRLRSLVEKIVNEKDTPSLGFYLVTGDGKLTPLAVYWIVFAFHHLKDPFCSDELGDWKELVKNSAAEAVKLSILEERL